MWFVRLAKGVRNIEMVKNIPEMLGVSVLVVEDNDVNQIMITEMLRIHGLDVIVDANGKAAVERLSAENHGISLVLMDLRMPVMGGYEASREIRKQSHNKKLPIIALSADPLEVGDRQYLDAGMNDYLAKPLQIKILGTCLKKWIKPVSNNTSAGERPLRKKMFRRLINTGKHLVGIDYESALDRLQGNKKLLNQLLYRFVHNYSLAAQEVRQALEESDNAGAERLLHTMKGMAGNLSAYEFYNLIVDIEKSMAEGCEQSVVTLLDELEKKFVLLGSRLNAITGVVATMPVAEAGNTQQTDEDRLQKLNILAGLLKYNNLGAEALCVRLLEEIPRGFRDKKLSGITQRIEQLDFQYIEESIPLIAEGLGVEYTVAEDDVISEIAVVDRVLIVDDVPDNIRVMASMLSSDEYEIYVATHGQQAIDLVGLISPDIILLDVRMPGMNGYDVCSQLKDNVRTRNIPLIFVTSAQDEQEEAYGLEIGAADYIQKPTHAAIVRARVHNHITLKHQQDKLRRLSTLDGLTGIANRRHFDDMLVMEIERCQRQSQPLSLIMCDIDYFKRYNDKYGHQAGDECLIQVAQTLSAKFQRAGDLVARYGGEEFVILLPSTGREVACLMAERVRQAIQDEGISHEDSPHRTVSMSFGVATRPPRSPEPRETLVRVADDALYAAKANGRNRVEYLPFTGT